MGLFNRISDLLKSNINDLIARAEDPEKLLNAAIEEMQKQIGEARSRVAMSIADEKKLARQHETQANKAADWEKKAMAAIRAGRDDLAVEALQRKREAEIAAAQFEEQLDTQQAAVSALKRALTDLSSKLEDTKRKRAILATRQKRAEAQRHVAQTLAAASESSASERLERLEARVEVAEAEAQATWEVANIGPSHAEDELSEEIRLLGGPSVLDDDLALLKAKMREEGLLDAPPRPMALPSPARDDEPDLGSRPPAAHDD